MARCWAAELRNCSSKISREHIVTESLWDEKIDVVGFSWCKSSPATISRGSFTSKLLCTKHNSDLSPTDATAKIAFDAFRECIRLSQDTTSLERRRRKPVRFEVDGGLLERWFLKTLINICLLKESADLLWMVNGRPLAEVPLQLVEAAFGVRPLLRPQGLFAAATVGQQEPSRDELGFAPLLNQGVALSGALYTFRGQRFLLYLGHATPPEQLDLPGTGMPHWQSSLLRYHLKRIQWVAGSALVQYIQYLWPHIPRRARRSH